MTWVDLSGAFGYGTQLTSTQMQNLRDNLTALAQGDSGAPVVEAQAMDELCMLPNSVIVGNVATSTWTTIDTIYLKAPAYPAQLNLRSQIRGSGTPTYYGECRFYFYDGNAGGYSNTTQVLGSTYTWVDNYLDCSPYNYNGNGYINTQIRNSGGAYNAYINLGYYWWSPI